MASGRTGRAGKLGTSITFLTNDDDEVMWVTLVYGFYQILRAVIFVSGTTSSKVCS